jgi:hypothetical protein
MRFITASSLAAVVLLVCFSPFKAAATQFVQISEPFVNVYELLDPKSTVVKMVKKGDRLELIFAGTSWYQVKVRDQTGWVERKAGVIVEGADAFSYALSIALILIALIGTIYGVVVYIKKQKTA